MSGQQVMIDEFRTLLNGMAGTKESIRGAKDWMLARGAHAEQLAVALRKHVVAARDFNKVLFSVYLLNDVFFNSSKNDPFRGATYSQLAAIVHAACCCAPDESARLKVVRVIDLWATKKVYTAQQIETLKLASTTPPPAPPSPTSRPPTQIAAPTTTVPQPAPNNAITYAAECGVAAIRALQQPAFSSAPQQPAFQPFPPQMMMPPSVMMQQQQQQQKPVAAPAPSLRCDLGAIPVGVMAGLVKIALGAGHEPWTPLDVSSMPTLMPAAVEPGRLEARVKEFYRVIEADRASREKRKHEDRGAFGAKRMRDAGIEEEASAPYSAPDNFAAYSAQQTSYSAQQTAERPRFAQQRFDDVEKARQDRAIGDDNLGNQMLRGMGWKEGSGLGSAGAGRVEPIAVEQQTDKGGVGSRGGNPNEVIDPYQAYRTHRSATHNPGPRR